MNLKEIRKKAGISQNDLAKKIGVSRSTVSMWEIGASQPDNELLISLSKVLNVSSDELLGNFSQKRGKARPRGVRIPVYGNVAAGVPILAIENFDSDDPDDWEEITEQMANDGDYIALRVNGDSMEPKISSGDVVIVRLQPDAENGDIVIARVNGDEVTCKKIKKGPEGLMLISTNPAYEPMFYSKKEIETKPIIIIGKVVELRAKF